MLHEPETIIDEEIRALWEPLPASSIGRGRRRRRSQRQRAVGMLLHPERHMERLLSGSLAEKLQGSPPTKALQKYIAQELLNLFWTILPEEDGRWLHASNIAHGIAEAVLHELAPLQKEEADPSSSEDEVPSFSRNIDLLT